MTDYLTTDTDLAAVANAIRTKGGTSNPLTYPAGFVSAIEAIPTSGGGGDSALKAMIERSSPAPSLPDTVTSIGDYAFYNYAAADYTSLPSGITSIGVYSFYGCTNLALSSLPSGLTSIPESAFRSCTNLALSSLPSGLTSIGRYAFYKCSNLSIASLPIGVTSIGDNAFQGCSGITILIIPSGVTEIKSGTFTNCNKLQTLVLRKTDAVCTLVSAAVFSGTPIRGYNGLTGTVYVPSALISAYQTATNWSTLYNGGTLTFAAIEGSQYEL